MELNYEDNPLSNLAYIKGLPKESLQYYVKGYILACVHIREAFTKGKLELLEEVLEDPNDTLLEIIKALDVYELLIKEKEATLMQLFPEYFSKVTLET